MPLNAHQLTLLRNVCQNQPGTVVSFDLAPYGIQAADCACWRWATSALGLNINEDPAQMFSAIMLGHGALNAGSAWGTNLAAHNFAVNMHQEYQQYLANGYGAINGITWDNWFQTVVQTVATSTCQLAGLTTGAGPQTNGERYFITMHYDRTTNGQNNAPNYTHWWITIDLGQGQYCCIEMFPGSTNLTFRFNNAYAVNDNVMIEVVDLTQNHLTVLNACIPSS